MKKIISFSLWGNNQKYLVGALRNAILAREHYPGWVCRFYIDAETQDRHSLLMHTLLCAGAEIVEMIPGIPKMMQRFLVNDDPEVERFLSRDCDSRIGPEEAAACAEWIAEDKIIWSARAHPAHARPINGGMWGLMCRRNNWEAPHMATMIKDFMAVNRVAPESYSFDQSFLSICVWNWARISATQHDVVCRHAYPGAKPFPVKWPWPRFFGEVWEVREDGTEFPRPGDWEQIKKEDCLTLCDECKEPFTPGQWKNHCSLECWNRTNNTNF